MKSAKLASAMANHPDFLKLGKRSLKRRAKKIEALHKKKKKVS
jgi:hypothetical protein